jgi:hypothetical protein
VSRAGFRSWASVNGVVKKHLASRKGLEGLLPCTVRNAPLFSARHSLQLKDAVLIVVVENGTAGHWDPCTATCLYSIHEAMGPWELAAGGCLCGLLAWLLACSIAWQISCP